VVQTHCNFMGILFIQNASVISAVMNMVTIRHVEVMWNNFSVNAMHVYVLSSFKEK